MRFESFEELLAYNAKHFAEKTAFVYEEDGIKKECTYADFYALVLKETEHFKASDKTCIAIVNDGSFDCIKQIFVANIAGLQIIMLDASLPEDQIQELCLYGDADMIYGEESSKYRLTEGTKDGADQILFFTSGTTSSSKAVVLTGQSLMQSAFNGGDQLPLSSKDTLLCILPLAHVFGFVCSLLWGLSFGATIALTRGARHYIDDFAYFKPTVVSLVPALLNFFLQHQLLNEELKLILIGGGDCPKALLDAVKQIGIRVSFGYGLTETSSGVAISVEGDPYAMCVCTDNTVTIADDGEVLIQAPTCMMRGYYKNPKSTEETLKNGILYTGDLGYLDEEGKLHITGRKKEVLVLSDGTKIFQPEYESKLAKVLETNDVAVLLKDGKPCLVYYTETPMETIRSRIKPVTDTYPYNQQIVEILSSKVPLPRTATGKIKRYVLEQRFSDEETYYDKR